VHVQMPPCHGAQGAKPLRDTGPVLRTNNFIARYDYNRMRLLFAFSSSLNKLRILTTSDRFPFDDLNQAYSAEDGFDKADT